MKIDGNPISPVSRIQAVNRVAQADKKDPTLGSDKIAVSDSAQVFKNLLQKVKALPDVREEKVRIVSDQIARGEFNLNSASIADSILSSQGTEGK
ncbi:MAG: flagellar biosynthesis anti-sigma factor FlgM [Eubacteriales bacterium]